MSTSSARCETGLNPDAKWPDKNGAAFDLDHEGHYGWKTAAVRDNLAKWSESWGAAPDIALIHLGTNDQDSKTSTPTSCSRSGTW
jgi:hypothetical protein